MRPVWLWLMAAVVVVAQGSVLPGAAWAQDWQYPLAVAAGDDGTIYVADRNLPGVWTLREGTTEVFVQASKRFRTPLNAIRCVHVDRTGTLFVGDSASRELFRIDADGALTQLTAGQPVLQQTQLSDEPAFGAENFGLIGIPMALATNSNGDLFVADTELQRVWKIPSGSRTPEEFLVVGGPRGIAVDAEDRVWVLSQQAPQLQRVTSDGQAETVVGDRTFEFPHQLALRADGTALVSDGYAKAIWTVTADGTAEKWIEGDPLLNPVGIAWQGDNLLIVDSHAKSLYSAAPDGTLTKLYPAAE